MGGNEPCSVQVQYYLLNDAVKMAHVRTLLRLYAQDRSVGSLASSLDVLLEGPIERRILLHIRSGQHYIGHPMPYRTDFVSIIGTHT